jgi:hypothetical protein
MKRLVLALLLAFVAVGCGGSGNQASVDVNTPSASAVAAIRQAGQQTQAADSARVSFTATFTGDTKGSMTGEGVFSKRRGHLTMDMSGLQGAALGGGEAEVVFDNLVYYMKLPPGSGAQLPGGKEWFKLDLAKLGQKHGLNLEQLTQLNQSDPSQALDFLQGASDDFHEVGTETVRGRETTHYAGTIDLEKVALDAPADVQEQYRRLAELSGSKKVPMDVWIGDDGLVHKVRFAQKLPGGSSMTMEEELYDFGTSADINVPSEDEVVDLTELLGNS